jgi:hypothetical protein
MRGKPFAAALLLVGLFVFALRIAPLAHPKKISPENQIENHIAGPLTISSSVPTAPKVMDSKAPDLAAAAAPQGDAHEKPGPKLGKERIVAAVQPVAKMKPAVVPGASAPSVKTVRVPAIAAIQSATLDIEIEHRFAEANLSIWVDSRLSYTHTLEGVDKKKLVVFHSVQGHEFHAMQVPPGNHQIKVQITADAGSSEHSGTLTGEFFSGKEKTLRIHFDKHSEMNLSLE